MIDGLIWDRENLFKVNHVEKSFDSSDNSNVNELRKLIEPWLSAIFQSEHLSVLIGAGLTTAVTSIAGGSAQGMNPLSFDGKYKEQIKKFAEKTASECGRGEANLEDYLRVANELLKGLEIMEENVDASKLKEEINQQLNNLLKGILQTEIDFNNLEQKEEAIYYLKSFLVSLSSRTASRDRLNIFTTNYDRFIEYGCDMAGIMLIDRFIGKILPVFRTTKLELDYHYNPPGIRGEPRYVEGVARLTKLHGSVDWKFQDGQIIKSYLPFGERLEGYEDPHEHLVIFPNSSKNIETDYFPYADLFKDFSHAICRPNSALVTYGYSFGDSHINQIIRDMLTVPSTHLTIISYSDSTGRIERFLQDVNKSQVTLLIGPFFGDLRNLVDNYLPKAAIDRLSIKMNEFKERRGDNQSLLENKNDEKVEGDNYEGF
ncbi:MAG: SIR2 family protein [Bacillaceae bacterium]|nr:SIR2 family protein [Bacillaceae bacterium]